MGEGHTASCPDFANLEKRESEYSCQTAAIWHKLKYILLENKQKKREREQETLISFTTESKNCLL